MATQFEAAVSSGDFKHINRHMAFAFGLLIFTLMLIVLMVSTWYLRSIMEREQNRLAIITTEVLTDAVSRVSFSSKYQARLLLENLQIEQDDLLYLRLVNPKGELIAHSETRFNDTLISAQELAFISPILANNKNLIVRNLSYGENEFVREVSAVYRGGYNNQILGVLQVGIAETAMETALANGMLYISLILCVLLIFGILITTRISQYFAAPVRKLASDMAHERQRLENILDAIHCGTWEWDIRKDEVILDNRWAEIIGYSLEELSPISSRTSVSLSHPDDVIVSRSNMDAHLQGHSDRYACEIRMRHKDGHWVWILDNGRITERDNTGRPLRLMGARQDISARKLAEIAYKSESERFMMLAKVSGTGVWEWDQQNEFLWCSPEYFSMLGFHIDDFDISGKPNLDNVWAALLHPDDLEAATQQFNDYINSNKTYVYESEFRLRHKNGGWIWVLSRGSTLIDEQGQYSYKTIGTHIDITSIKSAQDELKESQERLEVISNNIPDCVVFQLDCGTHGEIRKFTYLSDGAERIHGVKIKDALEDPFLLFKQVLPEDAEIMAAQEQISIENMSEFKAEIRSILPDGSQHWFLVSSSPRKLANQHIIFDGIQLDITERKIYEQQIKELNTHLEMRVEERTTELSNTLINLRRAQNELLQNEKLASLGALVAGVAHELNTPIGNAVMVATSLAQASTNIKHKIDQGLTRSALDDFIVESQESSLIIERNLERAAELISSFKQLAVDQTSYQRREFMLDSLVQEISITLHPTLRKTPYELINNIPAGIQLDSYPGPLGQVLINLINNALTHAFEGLESGTITITAELKRLDSLHISVIDNGKGIPEINQKKIFDPFFTTKLGHGGSGLGLHIIYTLVTGLLGGRIKLKSVEGQGCEFSLLLPLIAPEKIDED